MAETLVEKKICEACGADVRPGSLFCYNCGGAVSLDLPESNESKKKNVSEAWLRDDLVEKNDLKTTRLDGGKTENVVLKPIEKPTVSDLLEEFADKPIKKPSLADDAKLRSAANMRRRAKTFQKKTVEIVWEEPENAPNKWFPIVAIVLILLVVGIFYLAMYLK